MRAEAAAPRTLLGWLRALQGHAPRRDPEPAGEPGALRSIWPTLRVAMWAAFVVILVACKAAVSARLVSNGFATEILFGFIGVALAFGVIEEILERSGLIDKQKPARPAVDVAQIPVRPTPPPLADEATRAPARSVPGALTGGALPERLGGAGWGFEGGYVWKPEGREDG
jgi:hypothetical protein